MISIVYKRADYACGRDSRHEELPKKEPRPDGILVAVERRVRGSLDHPIGTDLAAAQAEGWASVLRQQIKEDQRELAFCLVAFRPWVQGQNLDPDLANLGLEPVNVRDGITIEVSVMRCASPPGSAER